MGRKTPSEIYKSANKVRVKADRERRRSNAAGFHDDRRLKRVKSKDVSNRKAIDDSMGTFF